MWSRKRDTPNSLRDWRVVKAGKTYITLTKNHEALKVDWTGGNPPSIITQLGSKFSGDPLVRTVNPHHVVLSARRIHKTHTKHRGSNHVAL